MHPWRSVLVDSGALVEKVQADWASKAQLAVGLCTLLIGYFPLLLLRSDKLRWHLLEAGCMGMKSP